MLLKSRIKTEVERGKLAELDRKQREGELVERSEVEEAAFSNARRVRDALMNIPARVASLYAAETDPQKIHQNLEDEIRNVLIDLIDETETSSVLMHAAEVYGTAFSQGLRPGIEVNGIGMGRQVSAALAARVSRSGALANGPDSVPTGDHGRAVVFVSL